MVGGGKRPPKGCANAIPECAASRIFRRDAARLGRTGPATGGGHPSHRRAKTQADPELKSTRRYTNLSAAEVRKALIEEKHYRAEDLPAERMLRDILNRMNYRLKRIQKGRPLKKTPVTDALFENVAAAQAEARGDPATLEISVDTKAKVAVGDYSRRENPDGRGG